MANWARLGLYEYCDSNPLLKMDPEGKIPLGWLLGGAAVLEDSPAIVALCLSNPAAFIACAIILTAAALIAYRLAQAATKAIVHALPCPANEDEHAGYCLCPLEPEWYPDGIFLDSCGVSKTEEDCELWMCTVDFIYEPPVTAICEWQEI